MGLELIYDKSVMFSLTESRTLSKSIDFTALELEVEL